MIKRTFTALSVSLLAALSLVGITAGPASAAGPYYFYAGAAQSFTSGTLPNGIYANLGVANPSLDTANDYHTLVELDAEQGSGSTFQAVEVGWNVDQVVNGDTQTRIFVGRWVNGVFGGYNSGGWVDNAANSQNAGSVISGSSIRFGVQYDSSTPAGGAWWVWVGTTAGVGGYIGYFPKSLWSGASPSATFTSASKIQGFGEVGSTVSNPCSDMGNGLLSSNSSALTIGSVMAPNLSTGSISMSVYNTNASYYSATSLSSRTYRYGGPGAC